MQQQRFKDDNDQFYRNRFDPGNSGVPSRRPNSDMDHSLMQVGGHPNNAFDISKDDIIGIDNGLRERGGRVRGADDIVDITKEIILRQQQQNMIEHLKMVDITDKLQTTMITKVVQRFKNKPRLYTFDNILTVFEVMANNTLNKCDDSNEFQSEVQKNMKKLLLIHIGLTAFFMMTLDKSKTPAVCKDRSNKIFQLIRDDNLELQ